MEISYTADDKAKLRNNMKRLTRVILPGKHNFEQMIHGYCDLFLAYFLERNPEWRGIVIIRNSSGRIVHAYGRSEMPDGRTVFADARGVFEDERMLLAVYKFKPKECTVVEYDDARRSRDLRRIEELELGPAIEEAYRLIYEGQA